jgi:hypothetical protein
VCLCVCFCIVLIANCVWARACVCVRACGKRHRRSPRSAQPQRNAISTARHAPCAAHARLAKWVEVVARWQASTACRAPWVASFITAVLFCIGTWCGCFLLACAPHQSPCGPKEFFGVFVQSPPPCESQQRIGFVSRKQAPLLHNDGSD